MKPEATDSSQSGITPSKQNLDGGSSQSPTNQTAKEAAAQLIRNQIDSIYDNTSQPNDSQVQSEAQSTPLEDINPYQRTHTQTPHLEQANDWKHYHTAWQNYYQKYYEGYYKHHLGKAKEEIKNQQTTIYTPTPTEEKTTEPPANETQTKEEAIFDMRQELLGKVHKSASKIRKSRHFVPVISGIIVVMIFAFLQYNRIIISNVMAYVSPGNIDPQNIVIDPNQNLKVGPEPKLIIPKINIDVPVIYDIGNDYKSQMAAMSRGVAHFAVPGASSHPGEIGNTVISGHSSNDLLDTGDYKFIFAQLEKLSVGDTIYANYKSVRYTYVITKKQVVKPDNVSALVYKTNKPVLTLITCTPIGTSLNRLLVTAEQVSPDPAKATKATKNNTNTSKAMPGNTPSFFERLFGA
jgi:sortase A